MDEYDTILREMIQEMLDILDAGPDSARRGEEFSTEERLIILSRRVNEMARSRPDTKPVRRQVNGQSRVASMRDLVFEERKERHEAEKAAAEKSARK